MGYTESSKVEDRLDRYVSTNPLYPQDLDNTPWLAVEDFWDEVGGNYCGQATGSPVFDTEAQAQEWADKENKLTKERKALAENSA